MAKTAKKKTATASKKTATKKPAAKKSAAKKRTPNAAFMRPVTPSADLAKVIGDKPVPRTEVTKKLWAYIKKNGLQDPKSRRMIRADDKLKPVFGGKPVVDMFEMTKLVGKHLK
jgi:upstream activation factor subunit UAF30